MSGSETSMGKSAISGTSQGDLPDLLAAKNPVFLSRLMRKLGSGRPAESGSPTGHSHYIYVYEQSKSRFHHGKLKLGESSPSVSYPTCCSRR